jgi:hypothetical protein
MSRRSRPSPGLLVVSLVLLGALAILGGLHLVRPDPAAIRQELAERIRAMRATLAEDPEGLDREMEAILEEERYRGPGGEARKIVEKEHPPVHAQAAREREARREAAPFLVRTQDVASISGSDISGLRDEGKALLGRYPNTRTAGLVDIRLRQLEDRLAATPQGSPPPLALIQLEGEVRQDVQARMFATARRKTLAFQKDHDSDLDLLARVRLLVEKIERAAALWAGQVLTRARNGVAQGRRSDALELLKGVLPELSGFPEVGPLEALARELR